MISKNILALSAMLIMIIGTESKRDKRLFDGNNVEPDEYPFVVCLLMKDKPICGGSIIGDKWIVTAAHCFANMPSYELPNLKVRSGSLFYASSGQLHSVKRVIYHREYRFGDSTSPNDIALMELTQPMKLGDHRKVISLSSTFVEIGTMATVIGWGRTESSNDVNPKAKQLTLTTMDPASCQPFLPYTLYTHQICATGHINQGTCLGDSGGPLVWNRQLIGIVSYGIPCATGHPDVFTSIAHYINWITEVMEQ